MDRARHYVKEIIVFLLIFGLLSILNEGGIRKYLVLLGVSGILFIYGFKKFKNEFLILGIPSIIYVFLGSILALILNNVSYQSVKEVCFAVIPLVAAISFFMASQKAELDFIKCQYWSMILLTYPMIIRFRAEDLLETQYAFIFGVFLLYFCIIKKELKYIIVTTFMMYLMNKRIAMLAAIFILGLYCLTMFLVKKKPEWKKKILFYLSLIAILIFLGYVFVLCTVNLEGQFIQDLTSGRSSAWGVVKNYYELSILWPGLGLGEVVTLLEQLQFPNFTTNLHNDLLKVFVEIGTFGYIIWVVSHFAICYWIAKKKNLSFSKTIFLYLTIIYTLLNYTTDNIMVYVNYWFPTYFVLLTVIFSRNEEETEEEFGNSKDYRLLLGVILALGVCMLGNVAYVYAEYKNPSKFTIPGDAIEVCSPDGGSVKVCVWLREGQPYYRIRYGGENLIEPSILGIETSNYSIEKKVVIEDVVYQEVVEEKDVFCEEDNPLSASYQLALIRMQREGNEIEMELRVYDSGAAFRYIVPADTQGLNDLTQIRFLEGSTLNIYDENEDCDMIDLSTDHLEKSIYRLPFTVQYESGSMMKISETEEENQVFSYATKARWKKRTLDLEFYSELNSEGTEQLKTPWRVFEIWN